MKRREYSGNLMGKYYWILVIKLILLSFIFKNSYSTFLLFISIFCTCIALSSGIIACCGRSMDEGLLYRNIGIGFLSIYAVSFVRLIMQCSPHLLRNASFNYYTMIENFWLEYIVVIIAFIAEYLETTKKKKLIFTVACNIIFLFIAIGIYLYYGENNVEGIWVGILLLIPLIFLLWIFLFFDFINIDKNKRKLMYKYFISIILYQGLTILETFIDSRIKVIADIIRLYAYYLIFVLIATNVVKQSYVNMKDKLMRVQSKQKELNKLLKKRNKNLLEVEHFIEKSGEKYEEITEKLSDGILIFNFNQIYYANNAVMNILKIKDKGDVVGKKFESCIECIYSKINTIKDFELIKQKIEAIEKGEIESFNFEFASLEGAQYVIYFFNMNSVTRIIYIKDMTEAHKNYKFKRKYSEYKKNEELKNKFYSNISHELRTPINLIYSALQLSEMTIENSKFENLNNYNKAIKHNCLRLIRTISNFIDTNKISEGYLKANIKVHNIVPVIENITLACYKYIKKIDCDLIFDSVEEEIYVKCDKEMIERVVLNILSNSVKFGSDGEKILVNIYDNLNNVVIKIRNDGCKINDDIKKHIFDKFTIINKSFDRTTEGSGLGLYLTKELLLLQGGRIDLKSDDKFGTEFSITLPRYYPDSYEDEELEDAMHPLEEKVDIEFSDIYI
ncbi:MAG: HAMP domain-containing histidine kinase [Clostridium sp.]|nr:HAMP domain-containing histidine kinase [Clostridium sp.]